MRSFLLRKLSTTIRLMLYGTWTVPIQYLKGESRMVFCRLTEAEHERLAEEARMGREMIARVHHAELLVLAATRCGFTNRNQYDCLIMALEKLTALSTWEVEMLLHVKPLQLR
jgi:hypothetical protein